jgi:uncharacterized protein (DUF433 family)
MDGGTAPVNGVSRRLKPGIPTATNEKLLSAIRSSARTHKITPVHSPMTEEPTRREEHKVNALLEFLKTQGTKATGSCMFSVYRISIRFILWYLGEHGRSVKDLTSEELWRIVRAYVPEFEGFNRLPEKEKTELGNILKYLKFLGDGSRGELRFKSHKISIDFIMTVVLIQGADIYSLTMADLWELIKMYELYKKKLGGEPQSQNISKYEQVTLLYAITYLRNDDGITGQIVIDGVKIPVSYILTQLKISGKDIRTVNIEQIHTITNAYISKYTPPTPVPLGKQPTEEQTFELHAITDLLKTQRSAAMGSFIFSGHRISVQSILSYLAQHRLWIDDLRPKELWSIMLLQESNQTQPLQ